MDKRQYLEEPQLEDLILKIKMALAKKQDVLTIDELPTENSKNVVSSGGVKTYVDGSTNDISSENVESIWNNN